VRALRPALVLVLLLAVAADVAAARPWAWLGVRIRDLSEQEMDDLSRRHGIREGFGVVIVGTPAQRAGLRNGDVVVAFEGRPVTETRLLQRLVASASPDGEVRLVVLRGEGRRTVPVRLTSMPREVVGERVAVEFGFFLRELESQGEPGFAGGAFTPTVAVVMRGSAAAKGGLEVGDVILQVNDRAVVSRDAAREALGEAGAERVLALVVRRGDRQVSLRLDAPREP
jgi:serine protease Do